jgi:hypothetical protein
MSSDIPTLFNLKKTLLTPKAEGPVVNKIISSYELAVPLSSPKPYALIPPSLEAIDLDVLTSDFHLRRISANFFGSYRFF